MQNLDTILDEVERALAERRFTTFRGLPRELETRTQVSWDTVNRPDFREFLDVAEALGIRLVVLNRQILEGGMIEGLIERLKMAELANIDRREFEHQIERLRVYDGFSCSLQLSFDHEGVTYLFEVSAPWYTELLDVAEEIDAAVEERMLSGGPDGGGMDYYSQN